MAFVRLGRYALWPSWPRSTSREAIVLAWLLRHPAGIQPVLGTVRPARLKACAQVLDVQLGRDRTNLTIRIAFRRASRA